VSKSKSELEFITVSNSAKRNKAIFLGSPQSSPNAHPTAHYLTHKWVPGRDIGAEGEGRKGASRRWMGKTQI
jgi:hypothetical protein